MSLSNYKLFKQSNLIFKYCSVLSLILASGTAYFFLYQAFLSIILLIIVSSWIILTKKYKFYFNTYFITYLFLIFLNVIFYNISLQLIGDLIFLLSTYIILSSFNYNQFKEIFLNVVIFLIIIGIILQILVEFEIFHPTIFNNGKNEFEGHYMFAFHVFGRAKWGLSDRLSSIFWEPGIFQMVLNLSLILNIEIFDKNSVIKKRKIKLFLIIIALIWTFSTTGYMVFFCIVLGHLFYKSRNSNKFRLFSVFFLIIISIIILISPVFIEKFSYENGSFLVRFNDILGLFKLILINPIIGIGVQSYIYEYYANLFGLTPSQSAGILVQIAQFGFIWFIAYLISISKELKKRKTEINRVFILIAIILLGFGEPIIYTPVMLIYALPFKSYNIKIIPYKK
ncbi:MAG: hypothetical protein J1F67_11865 [Muribaculaceae bacterium]|nr:hypothetical protein [Muribaculaceae bacterium]